MFSLKTRKADAPIREKREKTPGALVYRPDNFKEAGKTAGDCLEVVPVGGFVTRNAQTKVAQTVVNCEQKGTSDGVHPKEYNLINGCSTFGSNEAAAIPHNDRMIKKRDL